MKIRSIVLAIGAAVAIFSVWMGYRFEIGSGPATGAVSGFVAADNRAGFEGVRPAGIIREVTAYNVGVREQTSDDPCIGASGKDLCRLVDDGHNVCAANFVAMGTVLRIEDYGECVVLDRMHRRFAHRVDIAMKEDEIDEALEFGVKRRLVAVRR